VGEFARERLLAERIGAEERVQKWTIVKALTNLEDHFSRAGAIIWDAHSVRKDGMPKKRAQGEVVAYHLNRARGAASTALLEEPREFRSKEDIRKRNWEKAVRKEPPKCVSNASWRRPERAVVGEKNGVWEKRGGCLKGELLFDQGRGKDCFARIGGTG